MAGKRGETEEERRARKEAVKAQKAQRRLQRQGQQEPDVGRKPCDLCQRMADTLIRCTIDESKQASAGLCLAMLSCAALASHCCVVMLVLLRLPLSVA